MRKLQEQINSTFLMKLEESGKFDSKVLEQLKNLFIGDKRPKADDFVKIFTRPSGEEVK